MPGGAPFAPRELPDGALSRPVYVRPPRPVVWLKDDSAPRTVLLYAWRRQVYPDRRIYWEGLVHDGEVSQHGRESRWEWVLDYKLKPWRLESS
jgi:hypothetical protein